MIICNYTNGTREVTLYEDGTKTVVHHDDQKPPFPEAVDLKITNYCDMGCKFCHESSTTEGKHGDLDWAQSVLNQVPHPLELAVGGGNPFSHPEFNAFKYSNIKHIINVTVNSGHLHTLTPEDTKDINAFGVSLRSIKDLKNLNYIPKDKQVVFHLIAGVHSPKVIDSLPYQQDGNRRILVLGYKDFGFGKTLNKEQVNKKVNTWYRAINSLIHLPNTIWSFDNLAIEQLNIRRLLTREEWDSFFQGEDFTHTMYIDAVERKYAPTSSSPHHQRVDGKTITLKEFFNKN